MKHLLFFLFFLFPILVLAQNQLTDSLRYSQASKSVFQGTRKLDMNEVLDRMRPYPTSFELIESARNHQFFSTVFASAGALPIGFTLVRFIQTKEVNWPVFATGLGLVGASIPLNIRFHKQTRRAVIAFNQEIAETSHLDHSLRLSLTANSYGLGVRVHF